MTARDLAEEVFAPAPPGHRQSRKQLRRRGSGRGRARTSLGATLVGLLGELLITVGVLLGLFGVWQLWWTDVEAMRTQNELFAQVEQDLGPAPTTPGEVRTDTPAHSEPGVYEEGDWLAVLHVPRWNDGQPYRRTIHSGVDRGSVLDVVGIGHYENTQLPGEVGNFALAGHRQSYGKPFYGVHHLEIGDELIVETADAYYVYKVTESFVTTPTDVGVIAPVPGEPGAEPSVATITLTTCHPLFSTRERWIVHGELDHWVPRESGLPASLIEEG